MHKGFISIPFPTKTYSISDDTKLVKVSYYKLIEVGVDGTAESLAKLVVHHFELDGILVAVKRRLKGKQK